MSIVDPHAAQILRAIADAITERAEDIRDFAHLEARYQAQLREILELATKLRSVAGDP